MASMHEARDTEEQIRRLLERVRLGDLDIEDALRLLSPDRELELGRVRLDLSRAARTGAAEVIWGEGKSAEQLSAIAQALEGRELPVLITRVDAEKAARVVVASPRLVYEPDCSVVRDRDLPEGRGAGAALLVTAGTSDQSAAREAYWTLRTFGWDPGEINDVGVAGIHRLLRRVEQLRAARVIIVFAGMEGALPSVVGGLVSCPVIAVPTSVGYGAAFSGMAALLGMLTACASGITVCNIDNGFGAAMAALRILGSAKNTDLGRREKRDG